MKREEMKQNNNNIKINKNASPTCQEENNEGDAPSLRAST